jgi:hypothetical protein
MERLRDSSFTPGLVFAKVGNEFSLDRSGETSTEVSSNLRSRSQCLESRDFSAMKERRAFERTEGMIRTKPYDSFYTANMSTEKPIPVKYPNEVNRLDSRASFYNYYPSESLAERKLQHVSWEYTNKKL